MARKTARLILAALLACTFAPFHDAPSLGRTMDVVGEIVARVPCEELHFLRDKSIAALVSGLPPDAAALLSGHASGHASGPASGRPSDHGFDNESQG